MPFIYLEIVQISFKHNQQARLDALGRLPSQHEKTQFLEGYRMPLSPWSLILRKWVDLKLQKTDPLPGNQLISLPWMDFWKNDVLLPEWDHVIVSWQILGINKRVVTHWVWLCKGRNSEEKDLRLSFRIGMPSCNNEPESATGIALKICFTELGNIPPSEEECRPQF